MKIVIVAVLCISAFVFCEAAVSVSSAVDERRVAMGPYDQGEIQNVTRDGRAVVVEVPSLLTSIREAVAMERGAKDVLVSLKGVAFLDNWRCSDVWDTIEGIYNVTDNAFLAKIKNMTHLDETLEGVMDVLEAKMHLGIVLKHKHVCMC
eukprot:GHVS01025220.1.p2 GENE.GHVS01025220.1~~GHVS01025220.1.p2  ORF type:complete len:149 (+),score=17.36 GHVS01025220.1:67-513(+)